MTKLQKQILAVWDEHVDDDMSTEYALQYVANLTGASYSQVVGALSARAELEGNTDD